MNNIGDPFVKMRVSPAQVSTTVRITSMISGSFRYDALPQERQFTGIRLPEKTAIADIAADWQVGH